MKRIALAVALLVSVAAPAWAGFEEGQAAYARGDYETAVREWVPLAEQGNASVQFALGHRYAMGQGVSQDDAKAVKWFHLPNRLQCWPLSHRPHTPLRLPVRSRTLKC